MDSSLSGIIKEKAFGLGFHLCGIAKSRNLTERAPVLQKWCAAGMNDKMIYLERNQSVRLNPELVLPGTKSVVVTGLSYYSELKQKHKDVPVLSRYTYGQDYHNVISEKLKILLEQIRLADSSIEGRVFVDSGPLLEKAWAREAGLGWQGKHSIIISREIGSFFFIGILLLNKELGYDKPYNSDNCGDCTLCIEMCPTGAINNDRTIDARKCIANLTIENRDPIPEEIVPKLGGRVYGCDKCQEVCPWNYHVTGNLTPEFAINPEIADMSPKDWLNLSKEDYNRLFKDLAVGRVKYERFSDNIRAALRSL
jgi:epoxyqueuosine reductase